MRKLFIILFLFFTVKSFAQKANAGSDKTVYLTQGNKVMIGGRSSGISYAWTKIYDVQQPHAGFPIDPATIVSPRSAITSVTGLIQGVWYYQLAVTTGFNTIKDTVVVRVDYDVPPAGGILLNDLPMTNDTIARYINNRTDTTQSPVPVGEYDQATSIKKGWYFFDRSRSNSMMIDSSRGKFYSTVEDGYHWWHDNTYARTEVSYGNSWTLDTNKTYVFEWKGYFPQDFSFMAKNLTVSVLMQIHPGGDFPYIPFGFAAINGIDGHNSYRGTPGVKGLYFSDDGGYDGNPAGFYLIGHLDSFVNVTHTVRLTIREGVRYPGQDAFMKVEIDGVQKYYRDTGNIGGTPMEDYPKFATIYDYNNVFSNPDSLARGRKFSLVTESFKVYQLQNHPIADGENDKTTYLTQGNSANIGGGSFGILMHGQKYMMYNNHRQVIKLTPRQ